MDEFLLNLAAVVVSFGAVFAGPAIMRRLATESPHHRRVHAAFTAYRELHGGTITQPKHGCVQLATRVDDILVSIRFDISGRHQHGRTVVTAFPPAASLPRYEVHTQQRWGRERAPEIRVGDARFDARFIVRSDDAEAASSGLLGRARRLILAMEKPPAVFSEGDSVHVWWSYREAPFEQIDSGLKIATLLATVCADPLTALRADSEGRIRIGDVHARASFEEREGHFGLFVECEPRRFETSGLYDLTRGEGPLSPSSLRAIGATGARSLKVTPTLWILFWPGIPAARGLGDAVSAFVTDIRGLSTSYR